MATIKDIALTAGVSKSTVSLALNTPERVGPKTLARIREAARKVGYVVDPLARTLASGRSRIIAMIVADISVPFFSDVLRELEQVADENGYFVVVADSRGEVSRELALIDKFMGLRVAGVALSPSGVDPAYAAKLAGLKMPLVCFDNKVNGLEADFVGSDNRLAGAMLAEHLYQLGHRRIGFIEGTQALYTAQERKIGFRSVLEGRGVPLDESLFVDGKYAANAGYLAAMRLLTRADRPSAIVAANSVMGMAALQAMRELGIDCPGQVSLAMMDEAPLSALVTPRPTMVTQDIAMLGTTVARRLFERILRGDYRNAAARTDLLPTQFIAGASCAHHHRSTE